MVEFSNSEVGGIMDSMSARLGSGGSDGSESIIMSSPSLVGKTSVSGVMLMHWGLCFITVRISSGLKRYEKRK